MNATTRPRSPASEEAQGRRLLALRESLARSKLGRARAWTTALCVLAAETAIVSTAEAGPGDSVLVGVVRDASDGDGIEGAVVIVTGEKLQGERTMTTDARGLYRIPDLPPGLYAIMVLHQAFGAGNKRTGVRLRAGVTVRVDVSLVRDGREVVEVDVPAPTVDVGSSATGLSVDKEMARRVPIAVPTGKGGANRSFEAIAEATPGAWSDTYGTSIAGTTSPENRYAIDGLTVGDPAVGLNGTPLSVEFLEEVRVEAGGTMPEHGRSAGGILQAVTKRGSNEFHGGVWAFYTPGPLEGRREIPRAEGDTIITERNLKWIGDAGFDVGGRLIRDRLWLYGGVSLSRTVYNLTSSWNRIAVGPDGDAQIDPNTGFTITEQIAGTTSSTRAQGTTVQALGKLTYAPAKNHTLELLGIHAPQLSGGDGTYSLDARLGTPEVVNNVNGDYSALARKRRDTGSDLLLTWNARTPGGAWTFNTLLGWHHQHNSALPVDDTGVGSTEGLAGTPQVIYRKSNNLARDSDDDNIVDTPLLPGTGGYREVHTLTDFSPLPDGAPAGACDATPFTFHNPSTTLAEQRSVVCPAATWFRGGPGIIYDRRLDRGQVRHIATRLARGAGHHVIKFGVDLELLRYSNNRGYSGDRLYRENLKGTTFADYRQYGFLGAPDQPHVLHNLNGDVYSTTIGGFLQDSWSIMDRVTLNAGVRYDAQIMFASDRTVSMALPNQISPRLGLVWDPTYAGKAKIFANYARFYQSIPLTIASRAGSGEPQIASVHDADVCDPTDQARRDVCESDDSRVTQPGAEARPDQLWLFPSGGTPAGRVPVDPGLKPQSSDEVVAGGEYEVFADTRLGLQYTHRWLNRVIEDMSSDEGNTYFIGNPGSGVAADFPRARRIYDAATLFLDRRFARHWLLAGSYTLSWLRGNISGLFRPENGQVEPNMNSDFDLQSLLANRNGDLPGDARHSVKLFVAGEIVLRNKQAIRLGGAVRARSGGPTSYLGAHALYGSSESYILPRGAGDRLPWTFSVDPSIGYTRVFTRDLSLTISLDIFNVDNFQQVLAVDQRYTSDSVKPIAGGTKDDLRTLQNTDGHPVVVNPNFGNPTAYQSPRQFRFGLRLTF